MCVCVASVLGLKGKRAARVAATTPCYQSPRRHEGVPAHQLETDLARGRASEVGLIALQVAAGNSGSDSGMREEVTV